MILGRGEEAGGGRTRERNLAGAFEALVGAVYIDQGYRSTRSLVRRLLGPELQQISREGARLDPKSNLQQMVQARWHEPPEYVTVEAAAGEQPRRFTVEVRVAGVSLGRGTGGKKSEAQREAAREAIARLLLGGDAEDEPCT
jgi:ribonuclease-3